MKPKRKIKFLAKAPENNGALNIKYADIFTIDFLPDNIKAHDLEGIKQSIRDHGFVEPIGINRRTGHDIFGNGRLQALQEMKRAGEDVPKGIHERGIDGKDGVEFNWYAPIVDGIDLDEREEVSLAIRMNKLSESGGIDPKKAIAVLKRLAEEHPERFEQTGYTASELDHIRRLARFQQQVSEVKEHGSGFSEEEDQDSREALYASLREKWPIERGEAYRVGRHTVICADNSDSGLISQIVSGVRLCFTSPPYDSLRNYETDGKFDWTAMMNGATDTMFKVLSDPGDIVVNLGPVYEDARVKYYWRAWLDHWEAQKRPVYGEYIWDKMWAYPAQDHGRLGKCHEYLFHFKVGKAASNKWVETTGAVIERGPKKFGKRQAAGHLKADYDSPDTLGQPFKVPDSVVRLRPEMSRGIHTKGHPAVFPAALPEFFINTFTATGDKVFDPFGGSGTTLVACERTDREGYMCDISENYCSLAIERLVQEFPALEVSKL